MLKYCPKPIALRGFMLASCLMLLAGCNGSSDPSAAEAGTGSSVASGVAVPALPTNLVAVAGNAQVSLTWSVSSTATSYDVKRSTISGGPYSQIASVTSASYTDAVVTNGTAYYYVVCAVNAAGDSADSIDAAVTPDPTITTPAVPMGLTATAGNAQVSITWSASSGATNYYVKRSSTNGGQYTRIGAPTATSYVDTSLTNGATYYYVVSALDSAGESTNSAQVNATPVARASIPPTPTGLSATSGNAQVSLTWLASSGATGYHVSRATTNGGPYSQVGALASATYSDTTVTNGTTYYYVVSAFNTAGESANSSQVEGTSTAPAGAPKAVTYVNVTPADMFVVPSATQQYTAVAEDQTASVLATQPSFSWTASDGTISAAGLYTAPATAGTYTITARAAGTTVTGSTTVTVGAAGTCASVPAAGTWDTASVSPVTPPAGEPTYEWNGKPMAVIVDPFTPSTVYLGTGDNGIFISTNCGAPGSWVKLDTGANHDVLDTSNVWSMQVDPDPSRKGVMYVLASYSSNGGANGLYKSVNGGVDWTQVRIGSGTTFAGDFWNNIAMDSSNTLHIAVTTHGGTSVAGYANGAIAESFDGGQTWPNIVQTPVAWGEDGGVYLIPGTTVGTTSTWVWGSDSTHGSYVTTDSGATWPSQYNLSAAVMAEHQIMPLQKAANGWLYLPALTSMLKSHDGINWSNAWSAINQTPMPEGIAITGSTIYAGSNQTMYSAPLSDDANWTVMPGPSITSADYIGFMAYDKTHGILYVSTWWSVFRYSVPTSSR